MAESTWKRMTRWCSWSRLRTGALATCAGCVAGCATLPALVAVGAGGTAGALSSLLGSGTELVLGSAAAALVLGVVAVRGLKREPLCSFQGVADAPIACTADLGDERGVRAQVDGYRAVFAELVGTERFAGGFRWRFRARPGLEAELRQLAEREHGCCSFLSFELTRSGDEIVWETTAPSRADSVLEAFFRLPAGLRDTGPGHDVPALKQSAEAAGLVFTGGRGQPTATTRRAT
jgi:hypothetical protein